MTALIITIHVIVCIALIGLVLVQRGRGGGLVESFQGVESMFGTKTNTFLTRTTTVLSVIFFISCLSLAIMSVRQSKSLLSNIKPQGITKQPISPAPALNTESTPASQAAAQNSQHASQADTKVPDAPKPAN